MDEPFVVFLAPSGAEPDGALDDLPPAPLGHSRRRSAAIRTIPRTSDLSRGHSSGGALVALRGLRWRASAPTTSRKPDANCGPACICGERTSKVLRDVKRQTALALVGMLAAALAASVCAGASWGAGYPSGASWGSLPPAGARWDGSQAGRLSVIVRATPGAERLAERTVRRLRG